jgi:hypothetical protein
MLAKDRMIDNIIINKSDRIIIKIIKIMNNVVMMMNYIMIVTIRQTVNKM